jgi:hypothetical protein
MFYRSKTMCNIILTDLDVELFLSALHLHNIMVDDLAQLL